MEVMEMEMPLKYGDDELCERLRGWQWIIAMTFLQRAGRRSVALGLLKNCWTSAIGVSWALSQLGRPSCIAGCAGRIDPV